MCPSASEQTRPTPETQAHKRQGFSILVVDDEAGIRDFLQRALQKEYSCVETAASTEEADLLRQKLHFDLQIVDICLPGRSGVQWLQALQDAGNPPDTIFMTGFADMNTAIEVLRLGACDLILKPFRIEQMRKAVQQVLERRRLARENFVLRRRLDHGAPLDSLIGTSPSLEAIRTLVRQVAPAPSAVLIEGETGTGKDLVARAIHQQSGRAGPFVPVNCGAIAPELMESELFGHIKGAFTGAHQSRPGLFSYADGGTLFLDEIAEMPLLLQTRLLRILEDGRIRPLGTERDTPVDVRIIAATNRSLRQAVSDGSFRQDLFYRLNVLQIEVPPLRARQQDIKLLAQQLSARLAAELGMPELPLNHADMQALEAYPWPGNVRELKNLLERCLLLRTLPRDLLTATSETSSAGGYPLHWTLDQVEADHIDRVLHNNGGNKTRAAEQLGIARKTLDRKRQGTNDRD